MKHGVMINRNVLNAAFFLLPMNVTVKIYDFALDLVRTLIAYHPVEGDNWLEWDGKNEAGDVVANGVYYYIVEKESGSSPHGKIVILD